MRDVLIQLELDEALLDVDKMPETLSADEKIKKDLKAQSQIRFISRCVARCAEGNFSGDNMAKTGAVVDDKKPTEQTALEVTFVLSQDGGR